MNVDRQSNIELLAGKGKLEQLKELLKEGFTQLEIDIALGNAIAYSKIQTAEYLLTPGADFSNYNYEGVYYAVHNNELEGLKYAISKGVNINVENGSLIKTSILTASNTKDITIVKWLLDNGADIKYLSKDLLQIVDRFGPKELKEIIKTAL